MPKYRLRRFGDKTGNSDLTLEIENHRARIYNDKKVYHDWGYVDCLDHLYPPGTCDNPLNWMIWIGDRSYQFGMSEAAEAALQDFWARGYLLQNPNAGRANKAAGLLRMGIGLGIFLVAVALGVVSFFSLSRGGGYVFWTGGFFVGGYIFLTALPMLGDDPVWQRLKEQMIKEGFTFDEDVT
jgi:hypothetical protein